MFQRLIISQLQFCCSEEIHNSWSVSTKRLLLASVSSLISIRTNRTEHKLTSSCRHFTSNTANGSCAETFFLSGTKQQHLCKRPKLLRLICAKRMFRTILNFRVFALGDWGVAQKKKELRVRSHGCKPPQP